MSSSDSTKNEAKENTSNEFYCTRCGVKSSIREETDCVYSSMSQKHDFQAFPKDTYCIICGVKPATRTECVSYSSCHKFQSLPKDTYCTQCGVKPGKQTICVSPSHIHDFV